jgi:hypothetical protein
MQIRREQIFIPRYLSFELGHRNHSHPCLITTMMNTSKYHSKSYYHIIITIKYQENVITLILLRCDLRSKRIS